MAGIAERGLKIDRARIIRVGSLQFQDGRIVLPHLEEEIGDPERGVREMRIELDHLAQQGKCVRGRIIRRFAQGLGVEGVGMTPRLRLRAEFTGLDQILRICQVHRGRLGAKSAGSEAKAQGHRPGLEPSG